MLGKAKWEGPHKIPTQESPAAEIERRFATSSLLDRGLYLRGENRDARRQVTTTAMHFFMPVLLLSSERFVSGGICSHDESYGGE